MRTHGAECGERRMERNGPRETWMRRECDENVIRYVMSDTGATEKGVAYRCLAEADERDERDAREKFAEPGKTRDTIVSFGGGRVVMRSPSERRYNYSNNCRASSAILIDIEDQLIDRFSTQSISLRQTRIFIII